MGPYATIETLRRISKMARSAAVLILILFAALSLPAPDVVVPPAPTPEPGTLLLIGGGLAATILFAKIRKSRR